MIPSRMSTVRFQQGCRECWLSRSEMSAWLLANGSDTPFEPMPCDATRVESSEWQADESAKDSGAAGPCPIGSGLRLKRFGKATRVAHAPNTTTVTVPVQANRPTVPTSTTTTEPIGVIQPAPVTTTTIDPSFAANVQYWQNALGGVEQLVEGDTRQLSSDEGDLLGSRWR